MITELFYSHIPNMNTGSLHTRSFRHIHFSVFDTDELKMALRARKVSGAFEKRAPGHIVNDQSYIYIYLRSSNVVFHLPYLLE